MLVQSIDTLTSSLTRWCCQISRRIDQFAYLSHSRRNLDPSFIVALIGSSCSGELLLLCRPTGCAALVRPAQPRAHHRFQHL